MSMPNPKADRSGFIISIFFTFAIAATLLFVQLTKNPNRRLFPQWPSLESTRIAVQRGLDPDAKSVNLTPKVTNLAEIRSMPRPSDVNARVYITQRVRPFETQTWTLTAHVIESYVRPDGDLYLVIDDGKYVGVVELPDPEKCKESPFYPRISALRQRLEGELRPSPVPRRVERRAQLTGIGFFGTASKADNGARLMPLLDLKWVNG